MCTVQGPPHQLCGTAYNHELLGWTFGSQSLSHMAGQVEPLFANSTTERQQSAEITV